MEVVGLGYPHVGSCELCLGQVDAREATPAGERLGLGRTAAAAELHDRCSRSQPAEQLVAPFRAWVVLDPVLPRLPGVDHRVVAVGHERRARIAHSTSTSSSRVAASARASASIEVSAVAIT